MKPYFKVRIGYAPEDFISIGKDDLEKAQWAFETEAKVVFSDGQSVRGKDIITIVPDYNRMMNWNFNYRITAEDMTDVKRQVGDVTAYITQATNNVHQYLDEGKEELIGKRPLEIVERKVLASGRPLSLAEVIHTYPTPRLDNTTQEE
jgi:hypothetical protein